MEKALGIVAEYNPFHNGHKYHINKALESSGATVLIAAISGNITQRGEFALLDKWNRAELAVRNGVNLVVEIPTIYASNNAGYFARAGIEILENLGANFISFGIEGNPDNLYSISNYIINNYDTFNNLILDYVSQGYSYPRAREEIIKKALGEDIAKELEQPNNILAIEYLNNMKNAKPICVNRYLAGYHSDDIYSNFASASKIRNLILNNQDYSKLVPKETFDFISKIDPSKFNFKDNLFTQVISRVVSLTDNPNSYFGLEEGLGNIILRDYRTWKSYDDIISSLKSKRYTETRIQRSLINLLLGITKNAINTGTNYIRILAFDHKGASYLKEVKKLKVSNLPIITNINKDLDDRNDIKNLLNYDIKAADLYNLAIKNDLYEGSDYVKKPFILFANN